MDVTQIDSQTELQLESQPNYSSAEESDLQNTTASDISMEQRHDTHTVLSDQNISTNELSIALPAQGSPEETELWEKDREKVMKFIQTHAELYTDMTIVAGLETVSHAGNVEGGRTTGLMVQNPLKRFLVSAAYPLKNYGSKLDKGEMQKVLQRARSYHVRLGITYTNHRPRECYGDELFRQTYNYLMCQPWFLMDAALRRKGKEGIPPDVMQAAFRVAGMSARRLGIQGIGGETVQELQSSIDSYAEKEMFKDDETSASRRLGIQMAYSMVEALIHKLPSNTISEIAYHAHYQLLGITGATYITLPAYDVLKFQGLQKFLGMSKTYASSEVHQRLLKSIIDMIPASVQTKLMIPEIITSILNGEDFETFAQAQLVNFETEPDSKWGHDLTFPMIDPLEQK
jgi:hypothetical protein